MKSLLLLASLVSMAPTAAFAHHHQQVRETCTAYRRTETYKPGHYLPNGIWVSGRVVEGQVEIPCSPYGGGVPVAHHPHYTHSPVPLPQQQAQPLVVNNQSSTPQQQRCGGVIARMGLGGILGGVAGRYAVGGKKSRHTVLGTTIGAAAGSLIGRATC
ncbi:MAG: glycine zipper 2TM domain-containing protein [Synechococcus sp. YX04-3]|nr:MAG: glycine zipper 2TM domain-containing protein [Synechococcus sp. YX04-3]